MTARRRGDRDEPAARASDAVSSHIGFLLVRAHRRVRAATVDALAGSGLNPGQIALLGALSAADGVSQAELAAITGIEKSSMVILVDALEAADWVRRRPQPGDRRAHAIALTAAGRRRLRTLGPRLSAVEDALLAPFTKTERATLLALLTRFADDA